MTTTSLVLGAVWPGEGVCVVELDLSGGDFGLRLRDRMNNALPAKPTVVALAAAARGGGGAAPLEPYATSLSEGLSVIQAPMVREGMGGLPQLLPAVARALHAAGDDAIVDLGRVDTRSPELAVAAGADALVMVARGSAASVRRLKERLELVLAAVARQRGGPIPVYVVLVCPRRYGRGHTAEIGTYLAERGLRVDGVGFIGWDPDGVARLERDGDPRGKRAQRTMVARTATPVAEMIWTRSVESPELSATPMSTGA